MNNVISLTLITITGFPNPTLSPFKSEIRKQKLYDWPLFDTLHLANQEQS